MIKLMELVDDKKQYVGNCKTILDTDSSLFGDATEMAQAIDNSSTISHGDFVRQVNLTGVDRMLKLYLRREPDRLTYGKHDNLVWVYDDKSDTHYFFL